VLRAQPPVVDAHADDAAARFDLPPGQLIAQQCAHDTRYLLVQRDQGALLQTALIACDERQGQRLWECALDERPRRPRPALRP